MLLFTLAVLSAAPKVCGSDTGCIIEAVKTCGPAVAKKSTFKDNGRTTGTVLVSPKPKSTDLCRVELELVATPTGSTASARAWADEYNGRPQSHQVCEMEPSDLVEFFEGKSKSVRRPAQCYPRSCPAPTAEVEKGCSWSKCDGSVMPKLVCPAKTCALRVDNLCMLDGKPASDCSALDVLAYDCVASCPGSGDVVLDCRSKVKNNES